MKVLIKVFMVMVVMLVASEAYSQVLAREAQDQHTVLRLEMFDVIQIAQDSSLQSLIAENEVFAAYWRYKNYRAQRLPTLDATARPFTYSRRITQQFDNADQSFKYFETENLNSYGQLSIGQNLLFTGGKLTIDSDLGRLVNFGDDNSKQYSATQINIGLSQPILGFNRFKWDRQVEPKSYERAKMAFAQSNEKIAQTAIRYYFSLLRAEISRNIAFNNMQNADTLYQIGVKRGALTTITKPELLNLRLEYLNSQSDYVRASNELERSKAAILNFLNIRDSVTFVFGQEADTKDIEVPIGRALDLAKQNNPDYLSYRVQLLSAERNVDRTNKERRFQASLNASAGLNQRGETLDEAYQDPLDQQQFNLSLRVPILDWGVAKGNYQIAVREYEKARLSVEQEKAKVEQDIYNTILNFNLKSQLLINSREAAQVAIEVYALNKAKFAQGLIDVNSLIIYQQRKDSAQRAYLNELEEYWDIYFYIRGLTLYDFEGQHSLADPIDSKIGEMVR